MGLPDQHPGRQIRQECWAKSPLETHLATLADGLAEIDAFIIDRVQRCVDVRIIAGDPTDIAHVLIGLALGLADQKVPARHAIWPNGPGCQPPVWRVLLGPLHSWRRNGASFCSAALHLSGPAMVFRGLTEDVERCEDRGRGADDDAVPDDDRA